MKLFAAMLLCFVFCFSISGCSDKTAGLVKVSGTVTVDGKPLQHGVVRFLPSGNRSSSGNLDENGNFSLSCYELNDGAFACLHQVEITATESLGQKGIKWWAPKKYASVAESGLTADISGPTDSLVFELKWNGGKPFVEK